MRNNFFHLKREKERKKDEMVDILKRDIVEEKRKNLQR